MFDFRKKNSASLRVHCARDAKSNLNSTDAKFAIKKIAQICLSQP